MLPLQGLDKSFPEWPQGSYYVIKGINSHSDLCHLYHAIHTHQTVWHGTSGYWIDQVPSLDTPWLLLSEKSGILVLCGKLAIIYLINSSASRSTYFDSHLSRLVMLNWVVKQVNHSEKCVHECVQEGNTEGGKHENVSRMHLVGYCVGYHEELGFLTINWTFTI